MTLPQSQSIDDRLFATTIASPGPITLGEVDRALDAGVRSAHEAVLADPDGLAARIFKHDPVARTEFRDDAGWCAAFLKNHRALRNGPSCDARPFTTAEIEALALEGVDQ